MFDSIALLLAALVSADAHPDLIIENVTVLEVESGEKLPFRNVAITDGSIISVSSEPVESGENTLVIDGQGKFLIPGLWDTHVHSVTNWSWHAPLFLAHGVTSVRNMHTSETEGYAIIREIKKQAARGEAPRMIANGFIVGGAEDPWDGVLEVVTAEDARKAVEMHRQNGMDFIKVYEGISPEAYRALMEMAEEAALPVDGHLPGRIRTQEAVMLGQRTIEHGIAFALGCSDPNKAEALQASYERPALAGPPGLIEFMLMLRAYDEARVEEDCVALARLMSDRGTASVPTIINSLTAKAELSMATLGQREALPSSLYAQWSESAASPFSEAVAKARGPVMSPIRSEIATLKEAGVTILAGTDLGNPFIAPGVSLLRELELLVEAGLSNREALEAATTAPAKVFKLEGLGCIVAGCKADLVLLEADPLESISNVRRISSVVIAGHYHSKSDLDRDVLQALDAEDR
ncbi:MAG: amidohydrolase family protein [Parvularcula sp.]|jgi:imidazolonepropionase-like amidohydrolase|nr:amidohydrolase family protein [Parvularcula sp.]